ncbi:MAG: multicopper oxidase family protein [Acidobacteriota bacterium]
MRNVCRVVTTLVGLAGAATLSAQQALPDPVFWSAADIRNKPLVIAPGTVTIGLQSMQTNLYNGMYIPPVFRLSPGDSLDLTVINQMLPEDAGGVIVTPSVNTSAVSAAKAPAARPAVVQAVPSLFEGLGMEKRATTESIRQTMAAMMHVPDFYTNVHYHGFGVSPLGSGDNVFVVVKPRETFKYSVAIPADHPTGLYWYHPHPHQISEAQVLGGMSGAMIIDGIEQQRPFLQGMRQRVMMLKHISFPSPPNTPASNTYSINGTVGARIDIRPGEQQFWRIANVGANANFHLTLGGPKFLLVAQDGNLLEQPTTMSDLFIPPGARFEVVVTGPPAGSYPLKTLAVEIIENIDFPTETTLATLVSSGAAQPARALAVPAAKSDDRPGVQAIRDAPVARRCTWTFTQLPDASKFMINNNVCDMNRVDTQVKLGTYEEWTIVNDSPELHTFHIHQTDYLVTAIDGKPVTMNHTQDTLNLPFKDAAGTHSVTIKIPFVNPLIVGEFVFHCHVLNHEDRGMMANIVVSKDTALPNSACK